MMFMIISILIAVTWVEIGLAVAIALIGVALTVGLLGPKFAAVLKEVRQALQLIRKAKDADSPGGQKITDQERQAILQEAYDVLEEIWNQYGGGILERIGTIFRRT